MLENCWQFVVAWCLIVCFSLVPPAVQAQDDPSEANVQLSPEKPVAAPNPSAPSYPSARSNPNVSSYSNAPSYPNSYTNESGYVNDSPSRPFQYPQYQRYPNYGGYPAQQQQYGEPYTRPGYYPSGSPDNEPTANFPQYESPQQQNYYQGGGPTVPAGLVIPIDLRTAISTQVAKEGDFIEATVSQNIPLNGTGYLPAGSVISGEVTESKAGRRLSRSGSLSIEFNNLRLPSGASFPMRAHLVGNIGRYKDVNGVERGEGWKAKLGQLALRGGGGAGLGAALGTGLGAICGGGSGAGTGAWAGAAFGGGLGAMDMLLRKGRDVIIPSGTEMKLQMEQPLTLPMSGSPQSY